MKRESTQLSTESLYFEKVEPLLGSAAQEITEGKHQAPLLSF